MHCLTSGNIRRPTGLLCMLNNIVQICLNMILFVMFELVRITLSHKRATVTNEPFWTLHLCEVYNSISLWIFVTFEKAGRPLEQMTKRHFY